MTEQWQELKETIKELRYSNGDLTQQEVCSFLGVYMDTLEKQMQEPTYAKGTIIKSALKYLVKRQIEEGSVGFAVDNDHDHDCCWDDVLAWLEAQPCEDCISRQEVLDMMQMRMSGKELYKAVYDLPSVTPRTNLAETSQDCISREAMLSLQTEYAEKMGVTTFWKLRDDIRALPSVTPKYTDEEIDKAQAVEQAYVDNMVELAVEEIKERYSDAIGKMKKAIDEMTEIHSDGEFYIKNVDAKWIISKYLCGAEMSGGEEDEVSD